MSSSVLEETNEISNKNKPSTGCQLDLQLILDGFTKCKIKEDELLLDEYLTAYIELNKFFPILGVAFNFVSNDVQKKITILQCFRKGGAGDYYYSFQSLLEHEKENGIIDKNPQSGSRNLLRLHRALEFIVPFLEKLYSENSETKMGPLASEIYQRTLYKHHSWFIGKTVSAIFYLVPTKKFILEEIIRGNNELFDKYLDILPSVIEAIRSVYELTQKLFEEYGFLNLP